MTFKRIFATFFLVLVMGGNTQANPIVDKLGLCLSDSTSGKDRKDLAKWIFSAIAAHPEIGTIAKPNAEMKKQAEKNMASLLTRLIADTCSNEMRAVIKSEGVNGVKIAFEHLGKMAMQELMSNQEVNAAISGFERYIDKKKLEPILSQ